MSSEELTYQEFMTIVSVPGYIEMNFCELIKLAAKYQIGVTFERSDEMECWESYLWEFMRILKRHQSFAQLSDCQAWALVEDCISSEFGDPDEFWDQFGGANDFFAEDAEEQFLSAWDAINVPLGPSPLESAEYEARRNPALSEARGLPEGKRYSRFINMAYHLQIAVGEGEILLPQQPIAEMFDVTQMSVSRMIHRGIKEGLIEKIGEHNWTSGLAARYRVNTDLKAVWTRWHRGPEEHC